VFALAQTEQRAVVTEDIADLSVIADDYDLRGHVHHGLVLANPSRYHRGSPGTFRRIVTALDRLLEEHAETTPASFATGFEDLKRGGLLLLDGDVQREELPWNLEFLAQQEPAERAVSRTRCLTVLVYHSGVSNVRCSSGEQMRPLNALCVFVETGDRHI
jgi:LSD1 subclass zinc finger protein